MVQAANVAIKVVVGLITFFSVGFSVAVSTIPHTYKLIGDAQKETGQNIQSPQVNVHGHGIQLADHFSFTFIFASSTGSDVHIYLQSLDACPKHYFLQEASVALSGVARCI